MKADTVALLDGDIMGAAWRAIVRPVSDAAGKRAERLRRERDVLRKLFSVYSRRELEDMKGKRFTVPGIPDAITKEQALSVLLNSGSAGNLRRLMAGRNLAEEQIRAIVDTLDERDVRFAQAVWDYFETFGKEISDLEESLTGLRPGPFRRASVCCGAGITLWPVTGSFPPGLWTRTDSGRKPAACSLPCLAAR